MTIPEPPAEPSAPHELPVPGRAPERPKPPRIEKLPVDARGYPIFAAATQPDGGYNFRGLNYTMLGKLIRERRCMLCGDPLPYYKAFIGGETSRANRLYSEPPMHEDCLRYAFGVCPWLLSGGWSRDHRTDMADYKKLNPDGDMGPSDAWTIVIARDFTMRRGSRGMPLFHPSTILDYRIVHPGEIDAIPPMTFNDGLSRAKYQKKTP